MSTTFTALVGTLREHSRPFVLDTAIENDEESLRAALARLRGYSVQATILLAQRAKSVAIASQQRHGDKLVSVIAGHPDSPESPIVAIDQALGARLATKHLIEQGYRNLLHVPGDLEWQDASERLSSYIAVCKEVGIDLHGCQPIPGEPKPGQPWLKNLSPDISPTRFSLATMTSPLACVTHSSLMA